MYTRRRFIRPAIPLLLLSLLASPAAAEPGVLGPDGMIFRLQNDLYGSLFPDGTAADPASQVLALDVLRPDGASERFLVPLTESFSAETAPSLVLEDQTGIAYLLWEGLQNGFHPKLYLTSFDGIGWGQQIEISSDPFARKSHPQLVVTREVRPAAALPGEDAAAGSRLVMHVAWSEENGAGEVRKHYAPIVIEDGEHLRWPPIWDLAAFLAPEEGPFSDNADALRIAPGANAGAVVAAWITGDGSRVATAEVELVPWALEDLAAKARAQIINGGVRRKSRVVLAGELRDMILAYPGLHEATLRYLAERVREVLLAGPGGAVDPEELPALAGKARAQIINGGVRFKASGLLGPERFDVVEVGRPNDPERPHLFKVTVLSERPAPELGGRPVLYLSPRGSSLIVAWDEEDRVRYVESREDGWGDPQAIVLGDGLDRDAAHGLLAARAQSR